MEYQIIYWILSALGMGGLISGLLLRRIDHMERKQDERENLREAARIEENMLIMRGIQSTGDLAEAVAIALKNNRTNGETERALQQHKCYKNKLNDYLLGQNAKSTAGKQI